jgi:hypothetical protein
LAELARHLAYLRAEHEAAQRAPLSARRALLVAMLVDAYADRLFAAQAAEDDILAFRTRLAAEAPALALVFDVAAGRARLVTEAVEVPLADYGTLSVQDFMVSLYNGHSVQRVRLVAADGTRQEAHLVLAEAVDALAGPSTS